MGSFQLNERRPPPLLGRPPAAAGAGGPGPKGPGADDATGASLGARCARLAGKVSTLPVDAMVQNERDILAQLRSEWKK